MEGSAVLRKVAEGLRFDCGQYGFFTFFALFLRLQVVVCGCTTAKVWHWYKWRRPQVLGCTYKYMSASCSDVRLVLRDYNALKCPDNWSKTETKLKQKNSFKTVLKHCFSENKMFRLWTVLAIYPIAVAISCLRSKPAAGSGTMTCADTGCDWLKQLKLFTIVL